MSTWINVARLHLVDRINYVALPWGVLAFDFAVIVVILAMAGDPAQAQSGALAAIYVFFLVLGLLSIVRSLPFALALGVSRRAYFTGTVSLPSPSPPFTGWRWPCCRPPSGPPAAGA